MRSRNLVSIRLLRSVGVGDVIDYATRFGFGHDALPNNLTLALGTLPATPLEVATGYAAFANGGYKVSPYFIDRIEDGDGKVVYQSEPMRVCRGCTPESGPGVVAPPDPATPATDLGLAAALAAAAAPPPAEAMTPVPPGAERLMTLAPGLDERLPPLVPEKLRAPRIITPANAWLMDDLMADVIKRGTGRRALVLGRSDISGKTGTTNDSRDTWFNGFNPGIEATVWVGFDQERPLGEGEEGSSVAVPIWVRLMREALRGVPDVPRAMPAGIIGRRIDPATGLLLPESSSAGIVEYFFIDKLPKTGTATGTGPAESGEPLF